MDGCVFANTSPELANVVFKELYDILHHRHIEETSHPDGVMITGLSLQKYAKKYAK